MIVSLIKNVNYLYFNLHAEEVFTSNYIKDSNDGIFVSSLQFETLERLSIYLKETSFSDQKYIVLDFRNIKHVQANIISKIIEIRDLGYKLTFKNIIAEIHETLSINVIVNPNNILNEKNGYNTFYYFTSDAEEIYTNDLDDKKLFYKEFENILKQKNYIDEYQKKHSSSFIYLNSFIDLKKFISLETPFIYFALYKLAMKIKYKWKSEIKNNPILVSQSLTSTFIVSILSKLLKLDILVFDKIGPITKLYNKLEKHNFDKRKYIVVSDLVCLGTEVKITKSLIEFSGGQYLGNVSLVKVETLTREDLDLENIDRTISIFSINNENNRELNYLYIQIYIPNLLMTSIILHISDLHVSLDKMYDGEVKNHDSYLSATDDNDSSLLYIERFIEFVKKQIVGETIYLLITGDITDWGEQIEFEYAETYLNKVVSELAISKENILLIPGDHDLNRRAIENQLAQNSFSSIEEINNAKYLNFKNFYKSFLNKDFNPNSVIIDNLIIEQKLQLIGINSSHKIDLKQKEAKIAIDKFEGEIKQFINNSELKNIICCHHNVVSSYENKKSGQWDVNNRSRFLSKLQELSINFIFSGNEHTSSLEKHDNSEILVSDSGPLSSKEYDSAFKIYELNVTDDIILTNNIYALQRPGNFEKKYYWDKRTNSLCNQLDVISIFIKDKPLMNKDITEIPSKEIPNTEQKVDDKSSEIFRSEINIYENKFYTDELYKKVKELNIFHSGHFHWSETSRAHNWIDISKLIEDNENLIFLKNAIIDVLEKKITPENIDLIIGLGYEGNILATKAAIKFNKPYSFLPYSYRHNEHHSTETELNFNNDEKTYKNVLIVTDVVNDGRTIRKLIKKRQNDFFSNVDKVYVISLFYTGDSILNNNILNIDFLKTKENYDLITDEEVNKIEFYTVKRLKVEKCPYGKNFRNECFIYKDELSCVNLFYDEKKYISQ